MALETYYTYSADTLKAEIADGKYVNLRHFMYGSMGTHYEATSPQWATTYNSITADNSTFVWHRAAISARLPSRNNVTGKHSAFAQFSATCMYFGVELIEAREKQGVDASVPIGLIQSAIGGSQIESWMDNQTLGQCTNESLSGGAIPENSGRLFYGMIAPFANYSVAGWVWYQGENNIYGDMGNSRTGVGYGCELPAMVRLWRRVWAASEDAVFGVATIAAGGSEGNGHHMAGMRWSQTANYGVLPNLAMPRSFLAQVYDLADPWAYMGDGSNPSMDRENCSLPDPATGKYGANCSAWDPTVWSEALRPLAPLVRANDPSGVPGNNFMGGIHPRLKRPVGRRLAVAAAALLQHAGTPVTGPTIAGCQLSGGGSSHDDNDGKKTLTLTFNSTLLGVDSILVQPFNTNMSQWSGVDSLGAMVCASALPSARVGDAAMTCEDKCHASGHCCTGLVSCDQQPSCAQGCAIATVTPSLDECVATCLKVPNHCTFLVGNLTLQTCAGCCAWSPSIPAPPGLNPDADCSPSNAGGCLQGCHYAHGAAVAPLFPEVNETTCGCQSWGTVPCDGGVKGQTDKWPCDPYNRTGAVFWYCEDGPGWKPPDHLRARGRQLAAKHALSHAAMRPETATFSSPRAPPNPYATIWTAAPVGSAPTGNPHDVVLDLSAPRLAGAIVHAVRYAWPLGDDGDTCCPDATVTGDHKVTACVPGSCPILSRSSQLPANPFFARINVGNGKFSCEPPQVCDA